MRFIDHGGVRLATESFGDPADPAVLLLMGATASMLGWPDALCEGLAERGLFAIRFDHRDTGASTTGPPGSADYTVEDMGADSLAILDGYGVDRAHLVGMSLGGFIAQMLALIAPGRVRSLTLIGSEPLGWDGPPLPHISDSFLAHFGALGTLDWTDRNGVESFLVESERLCAGPRHPFDATAARVRVRQVLSRTGSPASMFNHASVGVRDDWTGRFRHIARPVRVIHGEADPILPLPNGRALADGVSGASLTVLAGVGHELPAPEIPGIADAIAAHLRAAEDAP